MQVKFGGVHVIPMGKEIVEKFKKQDQMGQGCAAYIHGEDLVVLTSLPFPSNQPIPSDKPKPEINSNHSHDYRLAMDFVRELSQASRFADLPLSKLKDYPDALDIMTAADKAKTKVQDYFKSLAAVPASAEKPERAEAKS
jgi:hypothetical protein